MHPSGDYNKNVGEDSTQWGRYLNSNYVYIRARYFFLHPTHECPRGVIIALLNSKITFSQTICIFTQHTTTAVGFYFARYPRIRLQLHISSMQIMNFCLNKISKIFFVTIDLFTYFSCNKNAIEIIWAGRGGSCAVDLQEILFPLTLKYTRDIASYSIGSSLAKQWLVRLYTLTFSHCSLSLLVFGSALILP